MRLDVEVDDLLSGVLEQTERRLENAQPGLAAAVAAFHNREARMFATAGGGTWAPLADSTVSRKGNARVLVDDGGLLRDLTSATNRYSVVRYEGDAVFVGTKNPVAHLLRDGARGTRRRNPVPGTSPGERHELAYPVLDYLLTGALA